MTLYSKAATGIRNLLVLFFLVFAATPIVWLVLTSLKQRQDIFGAVLFFTPTFEAYTRIFSASGQSVAAGLINSTKVALWNTLIVLVLAVFAGYPLSRGTFRGRKMILFGVLASRLMPPVVVILPLFLAVRSVGMIDRIGTLAVLHAVFSLPLGIWLMKSFYDNVPVSLEEAAFIDGASLFQTLWRITLPLVRAGIVTVGLLAFIFSWNEFLFGLVFTSRIARTAPIVLANATYGEAQIFWADMSAVALIMTLPAIIVAAVAQKYLVRGLTAGSVK
jgi:ABC-type glycerol-3-phosphate transport system permease component